MKTPIAILSALVLALPACQSTDSTAPSGSQSTTATSDHAKITNEVVALAEVIGVEAAERVVTLRREDGTHFRVKCGEAVRNFAQIAPGDTLRVKYKETLDATRLPPEASATPTAAAVGAGRAKPGAQPGAGVGVAISVCVKIVSIDREREIVVFSLPSGELIARPIVTPEGREFVKGLKLGDLVRLDYVEVLALTVEKV